MMEEYRRELEKRLKTLDRALRKAMKRIRSTGCRPSGGRWRRSGREFVPCGLWMFSHGRTGGRGENWNIF